MIRKKRPVLQDSSPFEQLFTEKMASFKDPFCFERLFTDVSAADSENTIRF